jgi:hypothetical protein
MGSLLPQREVCHRKSSFPERVASLVRHHCKLTGDGPSDDESAMIRILLMTMILSSIAGGCAARRLAAPTALVAAYRHNESAGTRIVDADAVYTLSRVTDGKVMTTRFLRAGSAIGFDRDATGALRAVAGSERVLITDEPHFWRIDQADVQRAREWDREKAVCNALKKVDPVTEAIGAILYPPLCVLAIPFSVLGGNGSTVRSP